MQQKISKELDKFKNKKQAEIYQRFFKTGKGEYGEGDIFLGLTSQQIKNVAKRYFKEARLSDAQKLLNSKIHEHRMVALRILVNKFESLSAGVADGRARKQIYNFYLKNAKKINNWDLVDASAPNIVGKFLLLNSKDRKILYKLARSKNLWERRISIVSTFEFIRHNQFRDTIKNSAILLKDNHDLIHKACGWMLREVGKREVKILEKFLSKYAAKMPRVMLRYALEKFSADKRKHYLGLKKK